MATTSCEDIVKRVSALLNDQYPGSEYTRWPKEDVECALREARNAVNLIRPDQNVTTIEMKLQPGTFQQVPGECSELVNVIGSLDKNGVLQEQKGSGKSGLSKWFPSACQGVDPEDYEMTSFERDTKDTSVFYVQPPVPIGAEVTVKIQCAGSCASDQVDCRFEPPIVEYMMYRLLSTEDDSSTSATAANTHFRTFAMLLNVNFNMMQLLMETQGNASPSPEDQS